MAAESKLCDFGWKPSDFSLMGVDGKTYALDDIRGPNGTLVAFLCNHCPFVKAIADRLVRDVTQLKATGIGAIAVMSNDTQIYPADSFDHMKTFAAQYGFTFPYVIDETQEVARAWGAVCTPDYFGFNGDMELQFRGRLDASGREAGPPDAKRELFEAMTLIAETGKGPQEQHPSIGCSIKWRD